MNYQDLEHLYEQWRQRFGLETYRHISEILNEAKELHHQDWLRNPTTRGDHEQSWRAFKGKNLEKLVHHMVEAEVNGLGLKIISGNTLELTDRKNLSLSQDTIRSRLLVSFGEYGDRLPDVDLVIFEPVALKVIAVISSKVTLRERIAQTAYWKLKFREAPITRHIKVFFVTPDEDATLAIRQPAKKGRAIVEIDTDGAYVMTPEDPEVSERVKGFSSFIEDLSKLI